MTQFNRSRAVFVMALMIFVGSNLAQVQYLIAAYIWTNQLPATGLFRFMFWFVWLPLAALAAWCGVIGGYHILRNENLRTPYLTTFATLMCLMIRVDGYELGWAGYRLSLFLGLKPLAIGCNFLGVAFAIWVGKLRSAEGIAPVAHHPTAGTESSLV